MAKRDKYKEKDREKNKDKTNHTHNNHSTSFIIKKNPLPVESRNIRLFYRQS
jgi:hypothetical protein